MSEVHHRHTFIQPSARKEEDEEMVRESQTAQRNQTNTRRVTVKSEDLRLRLR